MLYWNNSVLFFVSKTAPLPMGKLHDWSHDQNHHNKPQDCYIFYQTAPVLQTAVTKYHLNSVRTTNLLPVPSTGFVQYKLRTCWHLERIEINNRLYRLLHETADKSDTPYVILVSSYWFFPNQNENRSISILFHRIHGIENFGRNQWKPLILLYSHQLDTIIT